MTITCSLANRCQLFFQIHTAPDLFNLNYVVLFLATNHPDNNREWPSFDRIRQVASKRKHLQLTTSRKIYSKKKGHPMVAKESQPELV